MKALKNIKAALVAMVAIAVSALAVPASAADWSTVTGGIDYSGEITAILAIVGVIATVVVTMKGGQWLLSALKKG